MEFHRGGEGCSHWSVSAAGHQIACACNADSLETVFDALQQVCTAVKASRGSSTEEKVGESNDFKFPTPANIRSQPLTYTPPTYKESGDESRILPEALEVLETMGFSLDDALEVIAHPLEVLPTHQWRSIYRGPHFEVVYSDSSHTILAVHLVSKSSNSSSLPRVTGKKSDRRVAIPNTPEAMMKLLKSRGFVVKHGGKHWKISYPPVPGVFASMPYTPSDHRWAKNLMTELRAKFGIDLRF